MVYRLYVSLSFVESQTANFHQTGAGDWHDYDGSDNNSRNCKRGDVIKPMLYSFFKDDSHPLRGRFVNSPIRNGVDFEDWDDYIKWLPMRGPQNAFFNYLELFLWLSQQLSIVTAT